MPLSEALHEAPGSLGTVRNAVLLLEMLADGPPYQQLSDLAERSGLSLPTVHRLLRSLVLADLVEQDPRSSRYGLGPQLVALSHRYLARLPMLGALTPYLAPVREATGLTVLVQVLVRTSIVCVDRLDAASPLGLAGVYREPHRDRFGLACAAGRLLLSRAPDETWKAAVAEADETVVEWAERSRDEWGQAGWLVGEHAQDGGPRELAVPVIGPAGPLGAVAVELVPDADPDLESIAGHLGRVVTAAVRTLGHG